ncbi:MAG: acyl-CoA dehydrogenase family protein [Pseudomonadota bacterium]|nr:acyl-CoA dehydrogenase family protein [Pseudomonadota bacterium]
MDLSFSAEDMAFRDEVRAFIAGAFDDELRAACKKTRAGYLPKHLHVRWQKALHAKGWATPHWPKEYGGCGWSATQKYIYDAEMSGAGAPTVIPFGPRMLAPVLMKFGSQAQKDHFLPKIQSSDLIICQGYSEPGSGSDLASVKMKCEDKGDHWLLNGSKIWTSVAQYADWIFCLVRTSNDGKPQEGISFILVDMKSPGVTVDPIITMDVPERGYQEVNQVFFEDVKVPKDNMIGEVNKGWTYAKYLLEFERGGTYSQGLKRGMEKVRMIATEEREHGERVIDDPVFQKKLADAETLITAMEFTELRVLGRLAAGQNPGPESSMIKCRGSELQQLVSELAFEAAGIKQSPFQPLKWGSNEPSIGPDWAGGVGPKMYNYRKVSIYAGSNEIQRNIMAKLILGL